VLVSALALSSACGRSDLLPGPDADADGGRSGRGFGGAAGSRPVEPMGGAGVGGVAGSAGTPTAGVAGAGGQPQRSLYCAAGERAVLYLLTADEALLRVDADTLELVVTIDDREMYQKPFVAMKRPSSEGRCSRNSSAFRLA